MRLSVSVSSFVLLVAAAMSLAIFSTPEPADAQNFVVARMYNGGSGQGSTGGYQVTANQSVDVRTWPPNCGVQLPASGGPPGTVNAPVDCPKGYIFNHPNNPVLANTGMNGANITFNATGFDYASTGPLIKLDVFWLQNMAQENYGVASIGPGLGVTGTGMITWAATGFDPEDLGTQMFNYDPPGDGGTTVFAKTFPPNAEIPAAVGYTGGMVYTPKVDAPRYGGTLGLVGESLVFLALTFNPGVYTTYSLAVAQTTVGTPIPSQTISLSTVPGASLVQRRKVFTFQKVRPVISTPTPGGFPVLGETASIVTTYGLREEGPWTTGMVFVSQMSRQGVFPTTTYRTETGTANIVDGVGTLQLVKPYLIRSVSPNGRNGRSFTRKLKLDIFVPEPGSTLLLASGVVGLLLIEYARRRRLH